jgi:hypothetical protein
MEDAGLFGINRVSRTTIYSFLTEHKDDPSPLSTTNTSLLLDRGPSDRQPDRQIELVWHESLMTLK